MIDCDPRKSLVTSLEDACADKFRCKSSSTEENTVIKLQNFMDNNMSKLTVAQIKIETFSFAKKHQEKTCNQTFRKEQQCE